MSEVRKISKTLVWKSRTLNAYANSINFKICLKQHAYVWICLNFAWVQNNRLLLCFCQQNGILRWWNLDESLTPKNSSKASPAPLNIPTPTPAPDQKSSARSGQSARQYQKTKPKFAFLRDFSFFHLLKAILRLSYQAYDSQWIFCRWAGDLRTPDSAESASKPNWNVW